MINYPEDEPHIHLVSDKINGRFNLRPCPFCGGKKIVMMGAWNVSELFYQCRCDKCHFGGMWQRAPELAGIDWNTRDWWHPKREKNELEHVAKHIDADAEGMKPCPKCGSKYLLMITSTEPVMRVQCADCSAAALWTTTQKKAVNNWNERKWCKNGKEKSCYEKQRNY